MKRKIIIIIAIIVLAVLSFSAGVWYAKKMFLVDWSKITLRMDASEREYLEKGLPKQTTTVSGEALKGAVAPNSTDDMVVVSVDTQKGIVLKSITGARYLEIPLNNIKGLVKIDLSGFEVPTTLKDIKLGSLAYIYYATEQKKLSDILKISFLEPGLEE